MRTISPSHLFGHVNQSVRPVIECVPEFRGHGLQYG